MPLDECDLKWGTPGWPHFPGLDDPDEPLRDPFDYGEGARARTQEVLRLNEALREREALRRRAEADRALALKLLALRKRERKEEALAAGRREAHRERDARRAAAQARARACPNSRRDTPNRAFRHIARPPWRTTRPRRGSTCAARSIRKARRA